MRLAQHCSPSDLMEAIIVRNSVFPDNILLVAARKARKLHLFILLQIKAARSRQWALGSQEVEITFISCCFFLSFTMQSIGIEECWQSRCIRNHKCCWRHIWSDVGVLFTHWYDCDRDDGERLARYLLLFTIRGVTAPSHSSVRYSSSAFSLAPDNTTYVRAEGGGNCKIIIVWREIS